MKNILSEIGEGNGVTKLPSGVLREARDFLKGCFSRKAAHRFMAGMLFNHPFLTGLDEEEESIGQEENFCCYEVDDAEGSCSFADASKMRMKKRKVDSSSSCLSDEWSSRAENKLG